MQSISPTHTLNEMAKLLFFSIKAIILLSGTCMVAPLAQMIDQVSPSSPPIIIYYLSMTMIWSHEITLLIRPIRDSLKEGFTRKGKLDVKQCIAVWFSLLCIRFFCIGKLNEIYFPEHAFSGETYYQLIGLITVILGLTATSNFFTSFIKKD